MKNLKKLGISGSLACTVVLACMFPKLVLVLYAACAICMIYKSK